MGVERLENWAGPGQADVLNVTLRAFRSDIVAVKRVQNQHGVLLGTLTEDVARLKSDVSVLKADVAELKLDVAEVKVVLQEILRHLPPGPAA